MATTKIQTEPTWSELLGCNNWENLLDPLDLGLHNHILRCGDLIQATYDAFNNDQNSKYCGASRYGKSSFFDKVMLENASNYKVSSFLYATARVTVPAAFLLHSLSRECWDRESNWIGYVAVNSDEASKASGRREIYVVWRGTTTNYEWINVLPAAPESAEPLLSAETLKEISNGNNDEEMPKVMQGWLTIYISDNKNSPFTKTSARTQVMKSVNGLLKKYKDENPSLFVLGHSLGACLAILCAFDLVENGVKDVPVAAFVFGSPQVGNKAFDEKLKSFSNLKVLHVRNVIDLIPFYPGALLGYVDTGIKLEIDTRKSPNLGDSKNSGDWHNLQGMLHVVAGWNGVHGEFELKVNRSLGLVNKSCSFLKEEYRIPGSWWVEKNKSMVRRDDGEWALDSPDEEDLPVPEEY